VADPDARDEELLTLEGSVPWIRRKGNGMKLLLNVVSALTVVAGIVLATPVRDPRAAP
jgi:hypothetical protein